jgi:hypothetical protein
LPQSLKFGGIDDGSDARVERNVELMGNPYERAPRLQV